MKNVNPTDTIVAIATAIGESGIGIVRASGPQALSVADSLFVSKDGGKPTAYKTYSTHYGWIRDAGGIVDEVLLTVMRSPRSYTKEDVVEINCHGGIVALRRVLDLMVSNGCRLAEPGEFTKRAFLNGRIDLAQAEAVLDIIRAKTDASLQISLAQLKGDLSRLINRSRNALVNALAALEADIDFPDENIANNRDSVQKNIRAAQGTIEQMLCDGRRGRIVREGVHVVICGLPNVGKSSLLNALLKEERSIVTCIPGTTRDTIEEIIDIRGIPVRIVDTAGIIEPRDLVEKKAIARSKQQIRNADLVLFVFDGSRPLTREDSALIRKISAKRSVAVINKTDLPRRLAVDTVLREKFSAWVEVSAKKSKNISSLEDAVARTVLSGQVQMHEPAIISNTRHIHALGQAQKLIASALDSLDNSLSPEFVAQDVKDALRALDGIVGKEFSADLLERIFSDFCIGK